MAIASDAYGYVRGFNIAAPAPGLCPDAAKLALARLDSSPGRVACWPWRGSTPNLQHSAPSRGASQRQRGADLGCRYDCLPPQLALLGSVQPAVPTGDS